MRRQQTLARLLRMVHQSREMDRFRAYPANSYEAVIRTRERLRRNRIESRILARNRANRAQFRNIADTNEVLRHRLGFVPEYEPR
jgi:hypothetical protein